jgi:hypothetical protein
MSLVKKCLKTISLVALLASSNVYATDITIGGSTVSIDDRESAGDQDAYGDDSKYNIDQMDVTWANDNTITVDILTNFDYTRNNDYGYKGRKIVFGDLLISTGSNYNYAFSLGNSRYWENNSFTTTTGGLYAINGTTTSRDYHWKNGGAARDGSVFGNTTGSELNSGSSSWSSNYKKISFSFNVGGISAFQNASSIALSWAMSCFNDDVHGQFAVKRPGNPNPVPEPATIFIMLLALAGLVFTRKKQANTFSA